MKLVTVKNITEIDIEDVQFVYTDKAITEVIIGNLHIRKGESYQPGLQVLRESPFEEEDRYQLIAKVSGFANHVSYYESEYEAKDASHRFEEIGAEININKVTVLIDTHGAVAGFKTIGASVDSDLPF